MEYLSTVHRITVTIAHGFACFLNACHAFKTQSATSKTHTGVITTLIHLLLWAENLRTSQLAVMCTYFMSEGSIQDKINRIKMN